MGKKWLTRKAIEVVTGQNATANKLKNYIFSFRFKSPNRYEDGRNIGKLESMSTTAKIQAPSLKEAKKLLRQNKDYKRDYDRFEKNELNYEAKPRISFNSITENGKVIKESAQRKAFNLYKKTGKWKKEGGRIMNDPNKNYNAQRAI